LAAQIDEVGVEEHGQLLVARQVRGNFGIQLAESLGLHQHPGRDRAPARNRDRAEPDDHGRRERERGQADRHQQVFELGRAQVVGIGMGKLAELFGWKITGRAGLMFTATTM
jgi:hypothetical protein